MIPSELAARRSVVRMSELAKMDGTQRVWEQVERWNPDLSVEGLKPHFSAYNRFVCEGETNCLLHTNRYFDTSPYTPGNPLALHVVGPTGVGKNSVLEAMNIPWVISDTERPIRPDEVQDETYHFVESDEMDGSIECGELVEYTRNLNKDGRYYRYGTHKKRVQRMIDSGEPAYAILINQDGITPISRFCGEQGVPVVRILILPNCPASEYFSRVERDRGAARVATAKAEIQYTTELYRIDAILGNPFDPDTGQPFRAAGALGNWLQKTFAVRLPQPSDGVNYSLVKQK